MDRQLKFVRRLAFFYFESHDNAWRTAMALRMKREMEGFDAAEQTEYLVKWLQDRGIEVDLQRCQLSLTMEVA